MPPRKGTPAYTRWKASAEYRQWTKKLRLGRLGKKTSAATKKKQRAASKRIWQDPQYRNKVTKIHKALWQEPEHRRKVLAARRKAITPQLRKKLGAASKKAWQNKPRRKQSRQRMKRLWQNPQWRKRVIETQKKRWQRPGFKQRMSEVHRERCTPELRALYSRIHKGHKFSKEHNQKISQSLQGHGFSKDTLTKISASQKQRWAEPISRKRYISSFQGRVLSEETKQKLREALSLDKNPRWLGGISFEPYGTEFNKPLKEAIRQAYNNTCPVTGKKRKNLDIHHINYCKRDNRLINLIPLEKVAHTKTNTDRDYWFAYFCYIKGLRAEDLLGV